MDRFRIKRILKDYQAIKARIRNLERQREEISLDIIESSPSRESFINKSGETEYLEAVQSSTLSDSTFSKVAKIEELQNKIDIEIKKYKTLIDSIDNGLKSLTDEERIAVTDCYINGFSDRVVMYKLCVSSDTLSRRKKKALDKLELALGDLICLRYWK